MPDEQKYDELTSIFQTANLTINSQTISKRNDQMVCTWQVYGDPESHDQVMQKFIKDSSVIDFNSA